MLRSRHPITRTTQPGTPETIKSNLSAMLESIKGLTELITTLVAQLKDHLAAEPAVPVRSEWPHQQGFLQAVAAHQKICSEWERHADALQDSIAGAEQKLATAVARLKTLLQSANVPAVGRPTIEDERLLSQCVDQLETSVARLHDLRRSSPADDQRRREEISKASEASASIARMAHDLAMAAIKNMRA